MDIFPVFYCNELYRNPTLSDQILRMENINY